jgi:hypothetical protein
MIETKISATDIRKAVKVLKSIDGQLVKDLREGLRTKLGPMAQQIAEAFPPEPPLSGMGGNRPTSWTRTKATIGFTPGSSRKSGTNLVSIRVNPVGKLRGIFIGEMAGMRSSGNTARGRSLISNLNSRYPMKGKAGRFGFAKYRLLRPDSMKIAVMIIDESVAEINKKLGQ